MTKKKIILIIAVFITVTGLGAGAYAAAQTIIYNGMEQDSANLLNEAALEDKNTIATDVAQIVERVGSGGDSDIRQLLRSRGYYEDELDISLEKYVETTLLYNMTPAEYQYLVSLVKLDYDFEKLLDIYKFLKLTNDDLSYIRKIYDSAKQSSFESEFWIDNAYETVKEIAPDSLTKEEIAGYVNQGISVEDILSCYEMSLQGVKSVRDILDARLAGTDWRDIAVEIYADKGLSKEKIPGDIDVQTMVRYASVARITNHNIGDILDSDGTGTRIKESVFNAMSQKNRDVKAACDMLGVGNKDKVHIKEAAKRELGELDTETVEQLIDDGYRIREIKEALTGGNGADSMEIRREITNKSEGGTKQ